jgi:hypothetical protein
MAITDFLDIDHSDVGSSLTTLLSILETEGSAIASARMTALNRMSSASNRMSSASVVSEELDMLDLRTRTAMPSALINGWIVAEVLIGEPSKKQDAKSDKLHVTYEVSIHDLMPHSTC